MFFILKDGWKHRNHENFELVWYEDMIDDLPKVIGDIADFIGYKVLTKKFNIDVRISTNIYKYFMLQISEEQIQKLTEYLHIDNFRKRPNNNNSAKFFRKGKVGDWMNHFKDPTKLAEFDQWIAKNNSENIPIKYEL